ncbi:hypothetical protein E2C01_088358 [Portunus trituberculatus]|uniref:Uncharacterized protein n=1 Tax=Portunus trituberculatus TaxID=210409 RepID=A0A5B7JF62_PORTR|nr:hypothetical protein [Portunus trituberculatus]
MCGCRSFRPTEGHERAGFVWLWASGMPVRDIAVRSGTSVTTVYRWIRRWQREGHVNTRPRNSRLLLAATLQSHKQVSLPGHTLPSLAASSTTTCFPFHVPLLAQDAAFPRPCMVRPYLFPHFSHLTSLRDLHAGLVPSSP